jgi:hypothetical protein
LSTTDSSFPHLVFENGILDPINSAPPENLTYFQDRLNRARDTKSPTESEYQDFVYRTQEAPNKQTMLLETSKLLKDHERGYRRVYNQALSDFPRSVGFNTGLSAPQPDMIQGLDLREYKPFPVRQELGGAAVPTAENNAITLPHIAGEWKARGKDMVQARTQAAYDGACMVYGRNRARSFLGKPDPAGEAYVQTFTTDGTTLNTFAHYSSQSLDQVQYHQYPTSSSFLVSSYDDFKQSRRRLRNQQDDAKNFSIQLRDELNEQWSGNHSIALNVPTETAHIYGDEKREGPNNQLAAEPYEQFSDASFLAGHEVDPFLQIPTLNNGYDSSEELALSTSWQRFELEWGSR